MCWRKGFEMGEKGWETVLIIGSQLKTAIKKLALKNNRSHIAINSNIIWKLEKFELTNFKEASSRLQVRVQVRIRRTEIQGRYTH